VPDPTRPRFEVVCKGCGRSLMTVERLRDPEIRVLADHLRACAASALPRAATLGEIMARVRVVSVRVP